MFVKNVEQRTRWGTTNTFDLSREARYIFVNVCSCGYQKNGSFIMIIVDKVLSQVQAASPLFTHTNNYHAYSPPPPSCLEGAIMACSMSREHQQLFYSSTATSQSICSDRQGVLDHLYPKRLLKSVRERCISDQLVLTHAFILSLCRCFHACTRPIHIICCRH